MQTVATAAYAAARRDEDYMYTHYEGWLPDTADLPTTQWHNAWCENSILRVPSNASPTAALQFPLPLTAPGTVPDPTFSVLDPQIASRLMSRINRVSY